MQVWPAVGAGSESARLGIRARREERHDRKAARADVGARRQAVLGRALAQRIHRLTRDADIAASGVQLHTLDTEQLLLETKLVARVAGEPSRGADHAMTRHDDRQRIPAQRLSHRAHRARLADTPRDARVRRDGAIRNVRGGLEHRALEAAPRQPPVERPVEAATTAADVVEQIALQTLELLAPG